MCASGTDGTIFTYIWKIENFDYCLEKKCQPLYSPEFKVNVLENSVWRLNLFPRGDKCAGDISCFLERVKSCKESANRITIDFSLDLLTNGGILLKGRKVKNYYFKINSSCGFYNFAERNEIFRDRRKYFLDDALCVCCRIWKHNLKLSVDYGQWFARTRMEIERKSFVWVIDNLESASVNQCRVFSVNFKLKNIAPLSFKLYLSNGNVILDIRLANSTADIFTKCKIAAIVKSSLTRNIIGDEHWFKAKTDEQVWNFPILITNANLVKIKKESSWDGVLKLQCECTISTGVFYNRIEFTQQGIPLIQMNKDIDNVVGATSIQVQEAKQSERADTQSDTHATNGNPSFFQNIQPFFNTSHSLQDDLQFVYQDKILCDFKLQSGKDVFQVHKAILSARSPVFRAMFESGMKEAKTDVVEIEDVDGDTLRRMLLFMYTDKTEQLKWECASKLYFAVDKYEILPLKKKCSNVLKDTASNACEILVLADMHQDSDLKQVVQNFILVHDKKILRSETWNKFEANNVQLAVQTMKHIYLKKLDVSTNLLALVTASSFVSKQN